MINRSIYFLLIALTAYVYIIGLFLPLMDNDAAHHANIALRMYLTGDYVNLIDNGRDYLDKPHLHFWLAALSYKLFGVSAFAYRFPSFLLSLLGIYSVYRLGRVLYNEEIARISVLIYMSAFSFILSLTDVRMDAILVASIAFSCWQLVNLAKNRGFMAVAGSAIGLAIGFGVKGLIGVAVPAIFIFFFLLYTNGLTLTVFFRLASSLLLFALLISPILYCYYLQFDMHPEKIVRGVDHIKGIRFILVGQSIDRYGGNISQDAKKDYLFFLYTFIWAFAPWALFCYISIIRTIKNIQVKKPGSYLTLCFLTLALLITFAGSKLPHYLNIVLPFASLLTASFLQENLTRKYTQVVAILLTILIIATTIIINGYIFPTQFNWQLLIGLILITLIIWIQFKLGTYHSGAVVWPTLAISSLFLLLNSSFYPQLLKYQGGQELAQLVKNKIDKPRIYFWPNNYSSSFNFSTASSRQEFADSVLTRPGPAWLVFDINYEKEIEKSGYQVLDRIEVKDFEITRLDAKFMNSSSREQHCSKLVIGKISRIISN